LAQHVGRVFSVGIGPALEHMDPVACRPALMERLVHQVSPDHVAQRGDEKGDAETDQEESSPPGCQAFAHDAFLEAEVVSLPIYRPRPLDTSKRPPLQVPLSANAAYRTRHRPGEPGRARRSLEKWRDWDKY